VFSDLHVYLRLLGQPNREGRGEVLADVHGNV
jgi:hypothetical protein